MKENEFLSGITIAVLSFVITQYWYNFLQETNLFVFINVNSQTLNSFFVVGIAFIALGFLLVNIKKGLTIILTIIFIPLISYLLISIGINKQYITYVIIILMTISP